MIYAVIVNELGLVGAAALLGVYLLLIARGLKTAVLARDSFSKLLATGLSFIIAIQVFVIVGGVTRVIPLTGVTLPFVAYGGSSVVMNFVLVALLLVISDRARRPYSPRTLPLSTAQGSSAPLSKTARPADAQLDRSRGQPADVGGGRARPTCPLPGARGGGRSPAFSAGLERLRRAIEHGLFVLHFQPIVSVCERRVCHYEALLRLADGPTAPDRARALSAGSRALRADRGYRPARARAGPRAARGRSPPCGSRSTYRRCRSPTPACSHTSSGGCAATGSSPRA